METNFFPSSSLSGTALRSIFESSSSSSLEQENIGNVFGAINFGFLTFILNKIEALLLLLLLLLAWDKTSSESSAVEGTEEVSEETSVDSEDWP